MTCTAKPELGLGKYGHLNGIVIVLKSCLAALNESFDKCHMSSLGTETGEVTVVLS